MRKSYWKPGDWNALCERCGLKRKSSELQETWDNLWVCKPAIKPGCWELRHPLLLQHPLPAEQPIPWSNPEPTDQFVDFPGFASASVTAASSSTTVTDSNVTTASHVLILGTVPKDPTMEIVRVVISSGQFVVHFSPVPTNDLTLYYRVVG